VAKRPPKLQSPSPSSTTARPSRKKKRIIRTRSPNDFPKVLYRFVQSVDDEIARWDSTGTGILFELHHPKLPQVLEQYFQRKSHHIQFEMTFLIFHSYFSFNFKRSQLQVHITTPSTKRVRFSKRLGIFSSSTFPTR
jgi:hypothetical protein